MTTDELDQLARELWYKRNETFGGSGEDCIKVNVLMLRLLMCVHTHPLSG
jgi:hypothetical protein